MPPLYRHALRLVLASCLLACGCSTAKDLGKTLGDLTKVQAELVKKFGETDVNLRVNSFQNRTSIAVTYINSPLNQRTTEDRAKRAQETAEIVKQHYPAIKNVSEIWVGFMRVTTRLVVFHQSEMLDAHGFDNEARALRKPGGAPVNPGQPMVRYLESQNQSEISIGTIQLEGTPENGVTLVPHFLVEGNVNKIKPKPPAEVSLDFAVFSGKPKFPTAVKIVLFSDDQVVHQTEDQFSTSKIGNDLYSEFLYLKVPTKVFLKLTAGSTVKIRLNDHEYRLTEIQIRQLRGLSDFITKTQTARN